MGKSNINLIERAQLNYYKKIIPECTIIFDVGCRGDSPFYNIKNDINIHLFDPADWSKSYSYGTYNQIALSDKEGEIFYYQDYESVIKRDPNEHPPRKSLWEQHRGYEVKTTTLKKYCQENNISHIDLLTIDTEGNDYNVLLGAGDFLKNIKYIEWEQWGEKNSYGNTFHKDIMKLLTDYNFTYECIGGNPANWIGKNQSKK